MSKRDPIERTPPLRGLIETSEHNLELLKCNCKEPDGHWAIQLGDKLYLLEHSNNLEVQNWVDATDLQWEREMRQSCTRWVCHGCSKIQLP